MNEETNPLDELSLVGGRLCLDFTNTVGSRGVAVERDRLKGYPELLWWGVRAGVLAEVERRELMRRAEERPAAAEAVFRRALEFREASWRVFRAAEDGAAPDPADLETVNREVARAMGHARIVADAEGGFAWGWDDSPEADRVLWPVARDAAELLTSSELGRVGRCAAESCGWLYLDTSRNRSRRWCDMRDCGNRAKVRRHYRRRRGAGADGGGSEPGGPHQRDASP
ncbi:MAG TPA: ABATE domain-containing protein [Longimicrobiaceae bacterium]|nr:ABATE domain-containing protein [Longimicrobiaceae bacterium]